jgi:hypothetical protein
MQERRYRGRHSIVVFLGFHDLILILIPGVLGMPGNGTHDLQVTTEER